MLAARLRSEHGWSDASILNISSRGLLLHGTARPVRGSYLEVRRGSCVIVGRVVWVESGRFGVRTQDRLPVDALIASAATVANENSVSSFTERRAIPRSEGLEWRYVRSRDSGRAVQFAMIAAGGLFVALLIFETTAEILSSPLATVAGRLASAG